MDEKMNKNEKDCMELKNQSLRIDISEKDESLPDDTLDKVAGGFNPFTRCSECGADNAQHEVKEGVATFRLCDNCFKKYKR